VLIADIIIDRMEEILNTSTYLGTYLGDTTLGQVRAQEWRGEARRIS